jgi:hypothetical protein
LQKISEKVLPIGLNLLILNLHIPVCGGVAVSKRQRPGREPASERGGMYEKLYDMRRLPHLFCGMPGCAGTRLQAQEKRLRLFFLTAHE